MTQLNSTAPSSLRSQIKSLKVSSVLQGNTADYGKSHLISEDSSSCWQSESGKHQTIGIEFLKSVNINSISMQFQGGFTPRLMHITAAKHQNDSTNAKPTYESLLSVEPSDSNDLQNWHCEVVNVIGLRFRLEQSSDFFGRIICYSLDVMGSVSEQK
jgi:hypothetical protein